MIKTLLNRFFDFTSDNRNSKSGTVDENPKSVGIFAIAVTFVFLALWSNAGALLDRLRSRS